MISRRTVLKLAAAALFPVVKLRGNVPDEKLLMQFCSDESIRYSLQSPFGVGSLTYATDGYAMVRAEIANRQEIGERRVPQADRVFEKYWCSVGVWSPVESFRLVPEFFCDGLGCPGCGSFTCGVCHGGHVHHVNNVVDVCGVLHSAFYMKRVLSLPNVAVCRSGFDRQAILFRADGFEGVSIGLNRVAAEFVRAL
jgi:hypothetical protein